MRRSLVKNNAYILSVVSPSLLRRTKGESWPAKREMVRKRRATTIEC